MNSLVVFLSLVAVAVAAPSGAIISTYAAPAIATFPAAVSSQSRIDIKSSPAVVSTAAVAPIARTVIAEPAAVAPIARTVLVAAPAAVSHQSRIDVKSSPAVITTAAVAPIFYAAPALLNSPIVGRSAKVYASQAVPLVPQEQCSTCTPPSSALESS